MEIRIKQISLIFLISSFIFVCFAEDFWMKLGWEYETHNIFYSNQDEIYINAKDSTDYFYQFRSKNNGLTWEKLNYHEYTGAIRYIEESGNYIYFTALDLIDQSYESVLYRVHKDSTSIKPMLQIRFGTMVKCNSNFYFLGTGKITKSDESFTDIKTVLNTNELSEFFNTIVSDSSGTLYAGSTDFIDQGGLYKSHDNGESWTGPGPDLLNDFISSMAVDSEGRIFVGTRGHYDLGTGRIYRSQDNGITWEKVVYEYSFISDILINSNDEIYASLVSGEVIYSNDHGDSWTYLTDGLPEYNEIFEMDLSPDGFIYLATYDGVYWSVNSTTGIEEHENLISGVELYQNYPNPFNPYTNIWYTLKETININLSVFNSKGELVRTLFDGMKSKGMHTVEFDASNLKSGIYFYQLNTEKSTETKKMLFLK